MSRYRLIVPRALCALCCLATTATAASRPPAQTPDVMVVVESFDDGVVNSALWQPVGGATLSESSGQLVVTRAPGTTGAFGVRFVNPFPPVPPITTSSPLSRDRSSGIATGKRTFSPSPASTDLLSMVVFGKDGRHMDSTVVDLATGASTYYDRDAFGALRARSGAAPSGGAAFDSVLFELARTYSLIPPACKGDKCDYGFDCCPLLIVAKWRLGASANRGGGSYLDPALASTEYGGVKWTTAGPDTFYLHHYEFHCGPDDYTGPEWRLSPNNVHVSGGQTVRLVGGPGFSSWGTPAVRVNNRAALNVTVVDDTTITFVAPASPTFGLASVSVKSATSNTEAILDEDLTYYASADSLSHRKTESMELIVEDFDWSSQMTLTGLGAGSVTWAVASGSPPPGVTLSPSGLLAGNCSTPGVYAFHVVATDALGQQAVRLVWLEVRASTGIPPIGDGPLGLFVQNPSRGETPISYRLEGAAHVRLDVLDASGRVVRTMIDAPQATGTHRLLWNGDDARGHHVPSGSYFYRLAVNGRTELRKAIVLH